MLQKQRQLAPQRERVVGRLAGNAFGQRRLLDGEQLRAKFNGMPPSKYTVDVRGAVWQASLLRGLRMLEE